MTKGNVTTCSCVTVDADDGDGTRDVQTCRRPAKYMWDKGDGQTYAVCLRHARALHLVVETYVPVDDSVTTISGA